ncbi:hypothetical protein HII36_05435 [Nonomuraea sp. NN258]|nr:hypothetical protein [Nonomuraea antri]
MSEEEITELIRNAAADGLRLAAEHVLAVSNQRVPHDKGALERSGKALVRRRSLLAVVRYNTPYAKVQHEDLYLHHKEGRTPKFLERAVREEAEVVKLLIAKPIREVLK